MRRILLLGLLFAAPCAFGQSNYAVLRGTIGDPQRSPVAGAAVQLTSSATHAVRRAASNDQGIFEITALWPGDYEIAVQATGFAALAQSLRLEVNSSSPSNLISSSLPPAAPCKSTPPSSRCYTPPTPALAKLSSLPPCRNCRSTAECSSIWSSPSPARTLVTARKPAT
jgi:hypothetical protein